MATLKRAAKKAPKAAVKAVKKVPAKTLPAATKAGKPAVKKVAARKVAKREVQEPSSAVSRLHGHIDASAKRDFALVTKHHDTSMVVVIAQQIRRWIDGKIKIEVEPSVRLGGPRTSRKAPERFTGNIPTTLFREFKIVCAERGVSMTAATGSLIRHWLAQTPR